MKTLSRSIVVLVLALVVIIALSRLLRVAAAELQIALPAVLVLWLILWLIREAFRAMLK